MSTTIITLSRYPDIFQRLADSVAKWEPDRRRTVVMDGEDFLQFPQPEPWAERVGIEPFIFARNANIGINSCGTDDVLLINDDCELTMPLVQECQRICKDHPTLGLLSPMIDGGIGNRLQDCHFPAPAVDCFFSRERLAFVCVFIPRKTIDKVGLLDERFDGYGGDDVDYSLRVQQAGLHLAITPRVTVKHGIGPVNHSTSFLRVMTMEQRDCSMYEMLERVQQKAREV